MTWSVIRKATVEDREKLEKRAESFSTKHGLEYDAEIEESALWSVENEIQWQLSTNKEYGKYLDKLWKRVVQRALKHPWAEGIAHGTVGFTVD